LGFKAPLTQRVIYALSTLASFLLLLVFTFIGYHMPI
jgi:hypothetical protein